MTDLEIEDRERLAGTASRDVALACIEAGIEAAHPERVVGETIAIEDGALAVRPAIGESARYDLGKYERVLVVGGGNAAGHVAVALEGLLGDRIEEGVVVTDDPAGADLIAERRGDHPVPSERGQEGAQEVLDLASEAGEDDLVIAAITGGASALLPAPASEVELADLQAVTEALLESGATIDEINAVRKHCSAIKGGRLAQVAAPATVVGILLSDVVGDDPATIGSGPVAPDPTTFENALDVLDRYGVDAPSTVRDRLEAGRDGEREETPTADDAAFDRTAVHVVASSATALDAAAEAAREREYVPMILSSRVRGEASESALTHVAIAEEAATTGQPVEPPAVLLSGGETTVTLVDDHGQGGPNQEFALRAAVDLAVGDVVVAAVDTDGIDGATDAAGAIVERGSVSERAGRDALARNDAYPVLDDAGALVRTGPSGTNVNDLRVLVIEERAE